MSTTFIHPESRVPVILPAADSTSPTLTQAELLSFPAFKTWHATLVRSLDLQHKHTAHPFHRQPYKLKAISVTDVDKFGAAQRLGFVKIQADVRNAADEALPGVALLRGGSVGMLVILCVRDAESARSEIEAEEHVLLTVQARVPAGSLAFTELPAGMVDDAGSFAGAAAKEIEEECGISVGPEDMLDMTALLCEEAGQGHGVPEEGEELQRAVYTSPGGSDEFVPLMLVRKQVSRDEMQSFKGKLTGERDAGEKITLKVVRLKDVWREARRDAKALSAIAIYEGLKREGRV